MTDTHTLLDRYCTCKTLCVWIPMDVGSFVWSVPPRPFQPYCPSCKIIANEYYEKNEQNALILTPKVAFQQFRELAAKDKEIEGLKVNNRDLAATRFELMNRVSELELCLRDVVTNSKKCTQCSASFIAERKLEGK